MGTHSLHLLFIHYQSLEQLSKEELALSYNPNFFHFFSSIFYMETLNKSWMALLFGRSYGWVPYIWPWTFVCLCFKRISMGRKIPTNIAKKEKIVSKIGKLLNLIRLIPHTCMLIGICSLETGISSTVFN